MKIKFNAKIDKFQKHATLFYVSPVLNVNIIYSIIENTVYIIPIFQSKSTHSYRNSGKKKNEDTFNIEIINTYIHSQK